MKTIAAILIFLSLSLMLKQSVFSHCEIPCGIYGDEMRMDMIKEHVTTIEKSMKMIQKLSKEKEKNDNQLVRWVNNKEEHAQAIQEIVYQYFMTQRVKPVEMKDQEKYSQYTEQLTLLHEMLVYSMKTKQTTDLEHIKKLSSLLERFREAYFGPQSKGSAH